MIAEIAAANAAFNVIKGALANGKELSALGSKVFDFFDNKAKIQEAVTKSNGSDMQAFMALEKIKEQQEHLRESMVYAGRAGMWDDWQKFEAAAARRRREKKEAVARAIVERKARMEKLIEYIAVGIATAILAGLLIYGIAMYMMYRK
jgi:Fe2+ transport system protein B